MGGINPPVPSPRPVFNDAPALYTKELFSSYGHFAKANECIEDVVLLESRNTDKALISLEEALKHFASCTESIRKAIQYLDYWESSQQLSATNVNVGDRSTWAKQAMVPSEDDLWQELQLAARSKGIAGFAEVQRSRFESALASVTEISEIYGNNKEWIKRREFQAAIHSGNILVTGPSAKALTAFGQAMTAHTYIVLLTLDKSALRSPRVDLKLSEAA